jgi:hypothetical protein
VLLVQDSETRCRYYKIWSLRSERTWTTSAFGWSTWTSAQRKLNLYLRPCSAHCMLQNWRPMPQLLQRRFLLQLSRWLPRMKWTSANVKDLEIRQAHRCHHACLTLSIVNVFWKIPLRPSKFSTVNFLCLSGDSLFCLIVFMNGLVESVSPRGDSDNVV